MSPEQVAAVGTGTARTASWFRGGRPVDPDTLLILGALALTSTARIDALRAGFPAAAEATARGIIQDALKHVPGGRVELRPCTVVGFPTPQGARCGGTATAGGARRGVAAHLWPTGRGLGLALVLTRDIEAADATAERLARGLALGE
jgi:hypothetical protein